MTISERQKHVRDCLAANAYFAGFEILLEADPDANPKEAAELEQKFEAALAGKGLAIVVLTPFTGRLDFAKKAGISLRVHLPIAIAENIEINRSAAGHQKPALAVLEKAMRVLLPHYEFADRPFGRPEMGNGLLLYYLQAETTHVVRAET